MPKWVRYNTLSLVVFGAFLLFLALQATFGWHAYNQELTDLQQPTIGFWPYLGSGHFVEATFENWESEFLQMGAYVLLTAFLVQKGSPESKPLPRAHTGGKDPDAVGEVTDDSPGPVKRGGLVLWIYENSLSIAFFGIFALSFLLHLLGGTAEYNVEQTANGEPAVSALQFLGTSEFWLQSMQNWQSEFLAVGALVVLSIFLRQKGSPQSKQVAEPHYRTGD